MGKLGKGEVAGGAGTGMWPEQAGGEWLSKALGGPVGSHYMCVWHNAQGRKLKEFPPQSCYYCFWAPPRSEPNSSQSQGKLAGTDSHGEQEVSWT